MAAPHDVRHAVDELHGCWDDTYVSAVLSQTRGAWPDLFGPAPKSAHAPHDSAWFNDRRVHAFQPQCVPPALAFPTVPTSTTASQTALLQSLPAASLDGTAGAAAVADAKDHIQLAASTWTRQRAEQLRDLRGLRDYAAKGTWVGVQHLAAALGFLLDHHDAELPTWWTSGDGGQMWRQSAAGHAVVHKTLCSDDVDKWRTARLSIFVVHHNGNHWAALAVDQCRWVTYGMDSLWHGGGAEERMAQSVRALRETYAFYGASQALIDALNTRFRVVAAPVQPNSTSCGMYTLDWIRALVREGCLNTHDSSLHRAHDEETARDHDGRMRRRWVGFCDRAFGLDGTTYRLDQATGTKPARCSTAASSGEGPYARG